MRIREAKPGDSRGIHEAHMKSIRELCAKDYAPEEIAAWGGRPYDEAQRLREILNDRVWVVEDGNSIEGYGHLQRRDSSAFLVALYFTPQAAGKGLGKRMMKEIEIQARTWGLSRIELNSTVTSLAFYRKLGFTETGLRTSVVINGQPISCAPMEKKLPQAGR